MPRNKIYAVVEGHGEAQAPQGTGDPAVNVLIVRVLQAVGCYDLFPARRPWRLRSCGDFFKEDILENTIRALRQYEDCAAVLVLVDMDDGCPGEEGPRLSRRIARMGNLPFSVLVVCAHREYEAWFLASLESIHPDHNYPGNPEDRRDAKGWLARQFGYRAVRDQASYTQGLDIVLARTRSRSFQHLYDAFARLERIGRDGPTLLIPQPMIEPEAA